MSQTPDVLQESLQRLRESSLPAGFEERLAERLAIAHRERKVAVVRLPRPRRVLLLLAAVALPAAAVALRGVVLQRMGLASAQQSASVIDAKLLPHRVPKALTATTSIAPPIVPARGGSSELPPPDLARQIPPPERVQPEHRRVQLKSERSQLESKPGPAISEPTKAELEPVQAIDAPLASSVQVQAAPVRIEPLEALIPGAAKGPAASDRLAKTRRTNSSSLRAAVVNEGHPGAVNDRERPPPKDLSPAGDHGNVGALEVRDRAQHGDRNRDRNGR